MIDDPVSKRIGQLEADNARLRRLLDREGVGAELRHQNRNVLAITRMILRRSAETSDSVADYAAHLEGRFDVILRMQNAIIHHRDGVELHTLVAEELLVFGAHEGRRVQLAGPRLTLRPRAAEVLGLAFHELATNAVKFGSLTTPEGQVAVSWQIESPDTDDAVLLLTWQESGGGPCGELQRKGFGSEVIERMVPYELKGDASFDLLEAGMCCELRLPLAAVAASVADEGPQVGEIETT